MNGNLKQPEISAYTDLATDSMIFILKIPVEDMVSMSFNLEDQETMSKINKEPKKISDILEVLYNILLRIEGRIQK